MQEEENMAGPGWRPYLDLDRLNDFQIWQLYEAVVANINSRPSMNPSYSVPQPGYDQEFAGGDQSQFASRSPTLQPSLRSSVLSTPVPGTDIVPIDDLSLNFPDLTKEFSAEHTGNYDTSWELGRKTVSIQSGHETPKDSMQSESLETTTPTHAAPPKSKKCEPNMKGPFFCTYCQEMHIASSFKMKADWKRHESKFHETGSEWHCKGPNCSEIFPRKEDLKAHSDKVHGHVPDTQDIEVALPEKRVYACGFKGCRKLTYSWKERCNHVARCMLEVKDQEKWSYNWRILNLLRQQAIEPSWKQVKTHWCKRIGIEVSHLNWDYKTARNLVQELECQTYGLDVVSFLERLFKLGLPRQGPSIYVATTQKEPATATHVASTSSIPASHVAHGSGQPIMPASKLSLADQRHVPHQNLSHPHPVPFETLFNDHRVDHGRRPHSVVMEDAPDIGVGTRGTSGGYDPSMPDDRLLSVEEFLTDGYHTNATPPLPISPLEVASTAYDTAKTSSPGSRIKKKGKEMLSPKRSPQPTRRIATNHPDLAPEYTVPGPARGRNRSYVANVYGMPLFYSSFQP